MRKIIFIITILIFSIQGKSQKIDAYNVWSELYPSNQNFDNEQRLIRKVNRDGADIEFRTKIEKTFFYNVGSIKKAIVILYSYLYDEENNENESCHACFPEFEIAYFTLSNGNWAKTKFIQNWKESTGSWGNGAELEMKDFNKVKCLVIKSSYGNQGVFYDFIDYFNIENLKKIKSIKKRI